MRFILLAPILLAGCATSPHEDWSVEEAAIRARIEDYLAAWNRGDAEGVARAYASDGDRISGLGRVHPDRASILEHYRAVFEEEAPGEERRLVYETPRVRRVAPGVAIADADYVVHGVGPDPSRSIRGVCTSVLVKREGSWLRVAHRNIVPDPHGQLRGEAADDSPAPTVRPSEPRVLPLQLGSLDQAAREYLEQKERAGLLFNVFRTAAHHPDFATSFDAFALGHVGGATSTLTPRQRELLILRTAWLCRAEYAWAQHARAARKLGFTDEEVERVLVGPDAAGWSPLEADLLRAVDELQSDAFITDATWAALAEELGTRQLIDLIATVGTYRLASMLLNSMGVPLDPGLTGFPDSTSTPGPKPR